jgi:hypothetical protein
MLVTLFGAIHSKKLPQFMHFCCNDRSWAQILVLAEDLGVKDFVRQYRGTVNDMTKRRRYLN